MASNLQIMEPWVYIEIDDSFAKGDLYDGTAEEFRTHGNMLHIHHLGINNICAYIETYKNSNNNDEPPEGFKTCKTGGFQSGAVSLSHIDSILTGNQWHRRMDGPICNLIILLMKDLNNRLKQATENNLFKTVQV